MSVLKSRNRASNAEAIIFPSSGQSGCACVIQEARFSLTSRNVSSTEVSGQDSLLTKQSAAVGDKGKQTRCLLHNWSGKKPASVFTPPHTASPPYTQTGVTTSAPGLSPATRRARLLTAVWVVSGRVCGVNYTHKRFLPSHIVTKPKQASVKPRFRLFWRVCCVCN